MGNSGINPPPEVASNNCLSAFVGIFTYAFGSPRVLEERYGVKTKLATKKEVANASEYIEKYLNAKFNISVNGEPKQYVFIGRKYDTDMVICYLEVPKVNLKTTTTIGIQNELLMDVFEEQQNIVHFKINGKKKSFILIKESNKGMLNL